MVRDGLSCSQAVASVGAALAVGRAAVSEGVTSIGQSPSLDEFSLVGPTEFFYISFFPPSKNPRHPFL